MAYGSLNQAGTVRTGVDDFKRSQAGGQDKGFGIMDFKWLPPVLRRADQNLVAFNEIEHPE